MLLMGHSHKCLTQGNTRNRARIDFADCLSLSLDIRTLTCCSRVSSGGMELAMDETMGLRNSRLSSIYGDTSTTGQRFTILEEDLEVDNSSLLRKIFQQELFELHEVRVLKQIPLPNWMKVFAPRIVRLQTGTMPFMEYARSVKSEVRQCQIINIWTCVDRLSKNRLSIDFRHPADVGSSAPSASSMSSHDVNDRVMRDKWILKFESKSERDKWAKLVQDAIDLLGWAAKFTLGSLIMKTENSSVIECSTWADRGKPSYVMKVMEASSTKQSQLARNEIEVQRMLSNYASHPNIVALYDSFHQKNKTYLVMENCIGGDLFDFIRQNGAMDEKEAKTLFRHIASAISHCHEHGIVHLDIKPENFFFKSSTTQLETIKLGDFGSAMQLDSSTSKKAMSCTVGYAAPEVLQNGSISVAADVFSAGAVLYTILCGYAPFSAPSEDEMLERTLSGDIVFDELEWWRISKGAKDLLKLMLHKDLNRRPSMEEVLEHHWFS
ncbi:camk cdpk protein kinase [Plasmopara halstedii]|uniref:Camk cdpk protein kinase n=1 Tax=Plasmopara halstedii TaxID=4781 RepID=A0A0P1AI33_PLAHL|nr:camk cdpk protein kinase [Plasmopara halstedii]CEG40654.1 camk cdpk protein kinase [Plasmopara halstedii]|eukprot:XP_024577023.1 camk cdpk protein kinase [Plasmopara halstedii]